MKKPKTLFIDIDGVLLEHKNCGVHEQLNTNIIDGTIEKIVEWDIFNYKIILITGRRESMRKRTEKQLASFGIFYDQLIMGLSGGNRIIINDRKKDSNKNTAFSINLDRNEGIRNVKI